MEIIEKTKIGYQFKAENGFDLLNEKYIKQLIMYHFILDDYQKEQFKNKVI